MTLPLYLLAPCPSGTDPGVFYAPLDLVHDALNRMAYAVPTTTERSPT